MTIEVMTIKVSKRDFNPALPLATGPTVSEVYINNNIGLGEGFIPAGRRWGQYSGN